MSRDSKLRPRKPGLKSQLNIRNSSKKCRESGQNRSRRGRGCRGSRRRHRQCGSSRWSERWHSRSKRQWHSNHQLRSRPKVEWPRREGA